MNTLDPTICRQARLSRDPRFDGEFFLAVTSTGIYCRPVCPARAPREENVRYFRTAAAAAVNGFRPCLRCRPESAPNSPAWRGTSTTVSRAMSLIQEGYLNDHPLNALAQRLGVGERYLRKLFVEQLGVSPSAVAQTQRLHFAQKLLSESTLPVTDIAYASGFGSVRRFNSAILTAFDCSPSQLRRTGSKSQTGAGIDLELSYRPPYDWPGVLDFFGRHAVEGIEQVDNNTYKRNLFINGAAAQICVTPHPRKHALKLQLHTQEVAQLMPLVARVRAQFDLDAQPEEITSQLSSDKALQPLVNQWPGIRSPVVSSVFECAVRAILGQQISIGAARNLCAKIVRACDHRATLDGKSLLLFPRPEQIAALPDSCLPMPGSRRETLRTVCRYFNALEATVVEDSAALTENLAALRGIGPWTIEILRMRGLGDPDAFPLTDLGLMKSSQHLATLKAGEFKRRVDTWKPWRSYAANLLWRNLCHEPA